MLGLLVAAPALAALAAWPSARPAVPGHCRVLVLGAGASGIAMGRRLQDLGIRWAVRACVSAFATFSYKP